LSILAKSEILRLIHEGVIEIDPFDESFVSAGSVDLRVGDTFESFREDVELFQIRDGADYSNALREHVVAPGGYYLLRPGHAALAKTIERVRLPESICAWIGGRSRFARVGLVVHITASFVHPGVNNRQVLELYNASSLPMAIHPGTRLCQLIFQETKGSGRYEGIFRNQ
jgi:dCTP deaminase